MILFYCQLRISTQLSLEELGAIISDRVLGGGSLTGKENYIRDEIPAIYTESEILGTRFILLGEPGDEGYYLETDGRMLIRNMTAKEVENSLLDISSMIAELLRGTEGIKVTIID